MRKFRIVVGVISATAVFTPGVAAPVSSGAISLKAAVVSDVIDVRGGYRYWGYGYGRYGYGYGRYVYGRYGWAIGGYPAGLVLDYYNYSNSPSYYAPPPVYYGPPPTPVYDLPPGRFIFR